MRVTRKRFKDASEPDAQGKYEYYYSGVIYRFVFPKRAFTVRRYDDTLEEASFLRAERLPQKKQIELSRIPYREKEFQQTVAYLRDTERVESISVLLARGYVELDLRRIARS
jgi:hypothetical protein